MSKRSLNAEVARHRWRLALGTAGDLLTDARLLADAGSLARARALLVLAREHVGRAVLLEDAYAEHWASGAFIPAHSSDSHDPYVVALAVEREVRSFWGEGMPAPDAPGTRRQERRRRHAEAAQADRARADRDAGLGLSRDLDPAAPEAIPSPVDARVLSDQIEVTAEAAEMLLIRDHSRAKAEGLVRGSGESTFGMQLRLVDLAHPELASVPEPPARRSWWNRVWSWFRG